MNCDNKIDRVSSNVHSNGSGDEFMLSTLYGVGAGCGMIYANVLGCGLGDGYEYKSSNMNKELGLYPRVLIQYFK